ncbi:hypothetical protein AUP68_13919 [Ilyonectria robusta]
MPNYTENNLQLAIQEVAEGVLIRKAANHYNIPYLLNWRHGTPGLQDVTCGIGRPSGPVRLSVEDGQERLSSNGHISNPIVPNPTQSDSGHREPLQSPRMAATAFYTAGKAAL